MQPPPAHPSPNQSSSAWRGLRALRPPRAAAPWRAHCLAGQHDLRQVGGGRRAGPAVCGRGLQRERLRRWGARRPRLRCRCGLNAVTGHRLCTRQDSARGDGVWGLLVGRGPPRDAPPRRRPAPQARAARRAPPSPDAAAAQHRRGAQLRGRPVWRCGGPGERCHGRRAGRRGSRGCCGQTRRCSGARRRCSGASRASCWPRTGRSKSRSGASWGSRRCLCGRLAAVGNASSSQAARMLTNDGPWRQDAGARRVSGRGRGGGAGSVVRRAAEASASRARGRLCVT